MTVAALLDVLDDLSIEVVALTAVALAEGKPGSDLTLPQWRTLVLIASTEGARASGLATRMGMSRPSMSRLIRRLEGKGLVDAQPHPTDRRATVLSVTRDGLRILRETRAARRQLMATALAHEVEAPDRKVMDALRGVVTALARYS